MTEIRVKATADSLGRVLEFTDGELDKCGCGRIAKIQLGIAVEELFINIATYAYGSEGGEAVISFEAEGDRARITFSDSGRAYNPLEKQDPDVTLSAEQRDIGGLGIFMVKKSMDKVEYEYKDGHNILSIVKTMK